ncbi:hypothetical protein PUN28_011286 [Cardiocondyla obscurior]|uniref:Uncharacterized protein n=1 Tax=Cardiocondyla obscurior TaxID=286306 RepID=A0AAW2FGE1_9HYME
MEKRGGKICLVRVGAAGGPGDQRITFLAQYLTVLLDSYEMNHELANLLLGNGSHNTNLHIRGSHKIHASPYVCICIDIPKRLLTVRIEASTKKLAEKRRTQSRAMFWPEHIFDIGFLFDSRITYHATPIPSTSSTNKPNSLHLYFASTKL